METTESVAQLTEEVKTITPEEAEAAQIKAAEAHARNMDPEETAARSLTYYTPAFEKLVDSLSRNELRRVLKSMITYPVSNKEYKLKPDSNEAKAFAVGNHLLEAKWVLIWNVYNQNQEQIVEQANKEKENESTENQA